MRGSVGKMEKNAPTKRQIVDLLVSEGPLKYRKIFDKLNTEPNATLKILHELRVWGILYRDKASYHISNQLNLFLDDYGEFR